MSDFISVIVSDIIGAAIHIAMCSEGVGQEATEAQQLADADVQVTDPRSTHFRIFTHLTRHAEFICTVPYRYTYMYAGPVSPG